MVGIVIVSHSATLAAGIAELIGQMARDVPFALAGGTENADEPIGTDPMRVLQAIEAAYSPDGVLVLMDLGSAIMSAEAAIELLAPAQQAQIYLCEAPLVEGALAAAVAAAGNAPIERVLQQARQAQPAKLAQLAPTLRSTPTVAAGATLATDPAPTTAATAELTQTFVIPNPLGIHARPAARLVNTVSMHDAVVTISKGALRADAASINQLITLNVRQGDEVTVCAQGPAAAAALAAIAALIADNLGDPAVSAAELPNAPAPAVNPTDKQWQGIPVVAGIALGPVVALTATPLVIQQRRVADVTAERARFQQAISDVLDSLDELEQALATQIAVPGVTAAAATDAPAILTAQRLMLLDPHLTTQTEQRLAAEQCNAEWAWQQVVAAMAARYETLADPYLRQRAVDLRDVGERVLRHLSGQSLTFQLPPTAGIVAVDELTPSLAAALDPALILGIVTARGGANDHSAILVRTLGIPFVTGVADAPQLAPGQTVALDGATGRVWPEPDPATIASLTAHRESWLAVRSALQHAAQLPAMTQDGKTIGVLANIRAVHEAEIAVAQGATGVGLFRTELLFMAQATLPDEETQLQLYRQTAAALGDYPLTVRTLDIGGDKPSPHLPMPPEANPFLGWRGLRYCLDNPELFRTQLRALLRAAADLGDARRLKIMFPMVSTVEEFLAAKALVVDEAARLAKAGRPLTQLPPLGVMIETPAAVFHAAQIARHVDFFSIGTNDLTQYVMAADRGNAQVAALVNALQPPVIQAIAQVTQAAQSAGIPVSLCGELAADRRATALLIGLGVTELSMNPQAVPTIKAQIRRLHQAHARMVAQHTLTLTSVAAVEAYLTVES
ncbi:MAG: phosphoenolpyruvate--protein phosphotransferase [Caldilinea sp. CFX5]|nr:phosphoenolpyruvate--protein phosphotransferase [Caldilinea sp. CFX5]